MPSRQKESHSDTPPVLALSEQQQTAVDLIVSGRNISQVAEAIGCVRTTVSRWANRDPHFMAALNLRRQELWRDLTDGLRALLPRAVEVLAAELDGDNRLAAAMHILKTCGFPGGVSLAAGPTDPQVIAAELRLAEDATAHAEEAATLEIARRDQQRFLDEVTNF
jgi:transposase-like protein